MILKNKRSQEEAAVAQRDLFIRYKKVFGGEEGKAVLYDLMNRFHVLNGHAGDLHKEGQRSVVLYIMQNCAISIKQLDELLKPEGD